MKSRINDFLIVHLGSIRKRLMLYSLLIISIMLVISIYTLYITKHFIDKLDYMFINNREFSEVSKRIKDMDGEVLKFLTIKNSDSFEEYVKDRDKLTSLTMKLDRTTSFSKSDMMISDISNMIDEYIFETNAAVTAKRGRDVTEYKLRYNNSKKIEEYIDFYIKKLNLDQFESNTNKYFYVSENLKILQKLNILIMASAFLLSITVILWYTNKISMPMTNLAQAADEISRGNFQVEDVQVLSNDETKIMAQAFNKMKSSLKEYIEEIHSQADIRAKLMEEQMKNLKMTNMLKNAQIKALQSQINPHFLFNTLNAGVQIAMMEDAEKTEVFLEKMSELFRYNLKNMEESVPLSEEIRNLKTYVYLLEARFGDLIKFQFNIDEGCLDIRMPVLILQPIIENSCIHGLGNKEHGGCIKLIVNKKEKNIVIIIEDDGEGMEQDMVKRILENKYEDKDTKSKEGHTTGIGLDNVISRLNLYFQQDNIIDIQSKKGVGTKVILRLPVNY